VKNLTKLLALENAGGAYNSFLTYLIGGIMDFEEEYDKGGKYDKLIIDGKDARFGCEPTELRVYWSSGWKCLLFGAKDDNGIVYRPKKGQVPNFFVRFMTGLCLGCKWEKDDK